MASLDVFTPHLRFLRGARAACGEGQEDWGELECKQLLMVAISPPYKYPIHAENSGGTAKG